MKKIITAFIVALTLSGCATSGNKSIQNETQVSIQQKLVKGVTTKGEVRSYFGDPTGVTFTSDGSEQWQYMLADMKISGKAFIPFYGLFDNGATTDMKQLIILFKGDVVSNYTLVNSKTETKSGLLN
ncbi:hypothetical protein [Tatumella citrea]|uniref:Lipoprotein SmpA/OmlA domain-containing protein n=1 Tax=Tatumella citrea TaxID=53336 RepID=A0A1Y0LQD7_TATCI|nr:hypothetical protein [Tatumella citrea]ARU96187.1 hypothetical protein A7K98_12765 [Tatumella citrea]ARV00224.1 hypothetical protein A7K99_12755 [Tatumella citrea]